MNSGGSSESAAPRFRVSVVVPALNSAATVGRQIQALLGDRDDTVQLVLVDNGSTDTTGEVMRTLTAGHAHVTIVHEPRRGVNRARNAGIAEARAPIVLLCDADDEIEPGWIDAMVDSLSEFDLAGSALRRIDHHGEPVGDAATPDAHDPFGWGIPYGWGGGCGFRRTMWDQLGGFDPRCSGGGDETEFFIRAQIAGASFAWCDRGVVRYTQRADVDAHARQRWVEGWRNTRSAYWYGRRRGWQRRGHLLEDTVKCALLLPLAPFSAHWRSVLRWRAGRRWSHLRGLSRLPGEIRRRLGAQTVRPLRLVPTLRFHRHWRHIDRVDGWLSRSEAAALFAAAAQVPDGEAIVEIGSWKGRSTVALARGCRKRRPLFAVDRSRSAAAHYDGPPIGLLFIDGEHTTEAVLDDHGAWAPHLAPDAMVVFHDRRLPAVRTAIAALRHRLPRRMLEIGDLAVFAHDGTTSTSGQMGSAPLHR